MDWELLPWEGVHDYDKVHDKSGTNYLAQPVVIGQGVMVLNEKRVGLGKLPC